MDVLILVPVYNDWPSFAQLVHEIDQEAGLLGTRMRVLAVDDGSVEPATDLEDALADLRYTTSVEIIRLVCNLGHQRAIATGLAVVDDAEQFDAVVIMDADGEDRPAHLGRLIAAHASHPGVVVVARRARRSEGLAFRAFYLLYKLLVRLLTGERIAFGNFCLIPRAALHRLVYMSEIWNSLAASVVRSRLPIESVPTARGARYVGRSSMSFTALVVHGLGMVSVYGETVLVRMLLFAMLLSVPAAIALVVVVLMRLFTTFAIPGWASTVGSIMIVILLQALILSVVATFLLLSNRSAAVTVPAVDARRYVADRRRVFPAAVHGRRSPRARLAEHGS